MNVNLRLSLFPVAVVFAALALQLTQSEGSAAFAQQHNQTDLEFTRERAQVKAMESRIDALRQQLAAIVAKTDQASAREHVLLSRDPPPPRRSGASNTARTRDESTESESERRIPATLTHRNRTITAADQKALRSRLEAAERTTRSLGERVNRPDFGAGLRMLDQDLAQIETEISSFE